MSDKSNQSVSGNWFGNYYYASTPDAFGFEAVFVQQGTLVEGSILDDGRLGEANVFGSFAGGRISFRKVYRSPGHAPINYEGLMGDDGHSLSGTWRIGPEMHGSWKAWRMDGEELPDRETKDELETDKVLVGPTVQPL
jgi:hypothetical protein